MHPMYVPCFKWYENFLTNYHHRRHVLTYMIITKTTSIDKVKKLPSSIIVAFFLTLIKHIFTNENLLFI